MTKYHHVFDLKQVDPTISDGPTELHIEFGNPIKKDAKGSLIAGIDRSIANGLRRILLSEVKTRGFGFNVNIPETYVDASDTIQRGNVTVFNSEHLSNRIGSVPIHDYVTPTIILAGFHVLCIFLFIFLFIFFL